MTRTLAIPRVESAFLASARRFISRNQNVLIIWLVLLAIVVISALIEPTFTNPRNFPNLMRQAAALMLVSIGQTFVLIIAGIDLSVGSTISLVVVIMAGIMQPTPESMLSTVLLGLAVGIVVGVVNGWLVTRLRLAPFMVTLATLSIVQGLALQLRATPPATIPREFSPYLMGDIGAIPIPFLIIIVSTMIAWVILRHTPFGRHLYAIGSNEPATRLSGMSTDRIKLLAFAICGFMAGAAAVFVAARSRAGDPLIGGNFAFDSITAVVLGGASLMGGVGSVWGTLAGVLIITILSNVLNLLGIPSNYQYILKGGLLVLAVMLYRRRR